jgi:photosynthetic reaction center H subunit
VSAAFTRYIDVAQVSLYIFWGFFAGLVFYLQRESKREGYPLLPEGQQKNVRGPIQGFPEMPPPKTFIKPDGTLSFAPQTVPADGPVVGAVPVGDFPGAPLTPTGNPLIDGIGPASWVMRSDVPGQTFDGHNIIVPLRLARGYKVARQSHDPHGWPVIALDGLVAGHVVDLWIDEEENNIRYLEIALDATIAADQHHILIPEPFVRYWSRQGQVRVRALRAVHFADIPVLRNPDEITLREEDRLVGYFGGGSLYATPERLGPVL